MARIVLGLGTSHGPMLSIPPEFWPDRVISDRQNPNHPFQGKTYTFDQMVDLRKAENLSQQAAPEVRKQRHERCQKAIHTLGDIFEQMNPDVAVVVGNDQMEIFTSDHVPAFAIFWGPYVEGMPRSEEYLAKLPPGIARAELDRTPPEYTQWPCVPELGRHLIQEATTAGFDVAQLKKLPTGEVGSNAAPHAYGFVYRRIMRDKVPPNVPVFVNTFYPPNQPTGARCFELGRALGKAIQSWDSDRTVAVVASGGLSHFVVDEAFDHAILEALKKNDGPALAKIPESMFQSGTSEIKNWIATAGAMSESGLEMTLADYVPCYRSEAGTGSGMGFAYWR